MEIETAASIVKKAIAIETGREESDVSGTDLLNGKFHIDDLRVVQLIEQIVVVARDNGHEGFETPEPFFDNDYYNSETATVDDMIKVVALMPLRPNHSLSEVADERLQAA